MVSQANFIKHSEKINTYPETIKKKCTRRNTPKLMLFGHHHLDTKTTERCKKDNYRPISLINYVPNNHQEDTINQIQQYIKEITINMI